MIPDSHPSHHDMSDPGSKMRWLMVEDALRDRWGHWLEYDSTFLRGLRALGDEVVVLCDRKAEAEVISAIEARPVLPQSIWHRMSDHAGALRRCLRLPLHALATFFAMRRFFARNPLDRLPRAPDRPGRNLPVPEWPALVFVPTVLVHHLLGWFLLLKSGSCPPECRILLFFPNLPLEMDGSGHARWNPSPTTRLMARLFQQIRPLVEQRTVVLGVETEAMQQALAQLIGMPVLYLPHPIELPASTDGDRDHVSRSPLRFACYGTARAEKGSDLLQSAIEHLLSHEPTVPANGSDATGRETGEMMAAVTGRDRQGPAVDFAIQWIDDFTDDDGARVTVSEELLQSGRVHYIRRYFVGNEYDETLRATDAMLLPYRASSYNVRVSRVVIEAMVHGMPVIATEGTTVWSQAREFGAGLSFKEGDTLSLSEAMTRLAANFEDFSKRAKESAVRARDHFSVRTFRSLFLDYMAASHLVIGDSHVARANWAPLDPDAWSYGIPGVTSGGLLELLTRSRIRQPKAVVLWIGANDVLQGTAVSTVLDNVRAILGYFRHAIAAKQVGLMELLPPGKEAAGTAEERSARRELNGALNELARETGIQWIGCADPVTAPDGFLDEAFTPDGIHLNAAGHEKVAGQIRESCAWLQQSGKTPGC
jgi:lysophospholipase L1-like esterase